MVMEDSSPRFPEFIPTRRALVRQSDGLVINAIELEEGSNWSPPIGHILLDATISQRTDIGDTWDGLKVTKPVAVIVPDPAIAISNAVADVVVEIDKAFSARTSKLTDVEKTAMKDKISKLITTRR